MKTIVRALTRSHSHTTNLKQISTKKRSEYLAWIESML